MTIFVKHKFARYNEFVQRFDGWLGLVSQLCGRHLYAQPESHDDKLNTHEISTTYTENCRSNRVCSARVSYKEVQLN